MARIVFDGKYDVFWLPASISNAAAPSLAAMNAGTKLTSFVPKDGFNPGVSNSRVTGGDLSTTFTDESMGTYTSQLTITAYKDGTTDTAYDVIGVPGATGAIVAIPNGPAAVGVKALVWPDVEVGQPIPMQTAENTQQKFTVDVAVRKTPNFRAIVVA